MATARKTASGNWRVRVPAEKDEDGKWKYKSFTAPTKKEAEYMAQEYLRSSRATKRSFDLTLNDAYRRYIDAKKDVLSPNTIMGYEKSKRNDFPELMEKKIREITQEDIQLALGRMARNHSPKTVRNSHGLLSAVLKEYRPDFQLRSRLPQKKIPEIYVPTDDDIGKLAKFLEGKSMEIPFLLAAFGPMRRGEICAITFSDLDGNVLRVNKAYAKDIYDGWKIKQPKTDNGYRYIDLPDFVVEKIKMRGIGAPEERICNLLPSSITSAWEVIREKLCLDERMRFHDLRHYCASRMHAMGIPDQYICERGGWDIMSLQRIYQHVLRDKKTEINKMINGEFSKIYDSKYDS